MEILRTAYNNYQSWLWSKKVKDVPFYVKICRAFIQVLTAIINDIKKGQLSLRAMSLVYTTIISIVPLIAISFSVLKGLGAHNQIKPFLLSTLDPLGEKKIEITDKIISFVDNIQVGVLGALGIAILLYTVIGLMQKIESAFNFVWGVEKSRNLTKRFNDYLSLLFVGPILIFLSTAMASSVKSNYFIEKINSINGLEFVIPLFGIIIPYLILSVAFTFMYSFIPNTKVNIKAAFIGGLMTALLWKVMGWAFTNFVATSTNHTLIYSAFATVIVFMVWIYLVWLVLLIGASISYYIQYPQHRSGRNNVASLPPAIKESLAIEVMVKIGKGFYQDKPLSSVNALAKDCKFSTQAIQEVVNDLAKNELLVVEKKTGAMIPKRPVEHISYYDIINSVRISSKAAKGKAIKAEANISLYKDEIDKTLKSAFEKKTLKALI